MTKPWETGNEIAYVLDTSAIVHSPECFKRFDEHDVIIPYTTLTEIDGLKVGSDQVNVNARRFGKLLEDILIAGGNLNEGVSLGPGKGNLFVVVHEKDPKELEGRLRRSADDALMGLTYNLSKNRKSVLVTKDRMLRIRANVLGIHAQDLEQDKVDLSTRYGTLSTEQVDMQFMEAVLEKQKVEPIRLDDPANQFYRLVNTETGSESVVLARFDKAKKTLRFVDPELKIFKKMKPKDDAQACLIDLLLDPDISIVLLDGPAGTGKTFLSMAGGLYQTAMILGEKSPRYSRVIYVKELMEAGKAIGYLPGDLDEKLSPWMRNLDDVLASMGRFHDSRIGRTGISYWANKISLEILALSYIRGRNIPDCFLVVDETQNLTSEQVKLVGTRPARKSKLVLSGDVSQIDTPYLDARSCGLAKAFQRLSDKELEGKYMVGAIRLQTPVRSEITKLVAEYM